MTAEGQDITVMEREDKFIDPSPLTDENDDIEDITSSTFKWVVWDKHDGVIFEKSTSDDITITSGVDGEWEIELDATDTDGLGGEFMRHEARMIDDAGEESVVMVGRFKVKESRT